MSKLTKLARGRECQVRIVGVCNYDPETTVLAHYRMSGLCGMGIKPHDLFGAWACSSCHDEIDGRSNRVGDEEATLAHLQGVIRTQAILIKEGVISL